MQPKLKSRTTVPWVLPLVIWIASLAMLFAGFFVDGTLVGIGFMMVTTSILVSLMAFGMATAIMEVPIPVALSTPVTFSNLEAEFFPKGAIAFFVSMIVFFGATWMGLYALMIYRSGI